MLEVVSFEAYDVESHLWMAFEVATTSANSLVNILEHMPHTRNIVVKDHTDKTPADQAVFAPNNW